jgi:predicted membrane protein
MFMSTSDRDARSAATPRLILGVGIALFGVVLTLDRLGLADADTVLRFWPLMFVAIGAMMYFQQDNPSGRLHGTIWMGLGAVLMLTTLSGGRVRIWALFWPAILILVGSRLVMQALQVNRGSGEEAPERLTMVAVLGHAKRSSIGRFRGGDIMAFMGGGNLDLRMANIPPGEEATIDVFAMMGGVEIIVPPGWTVSTPLLPVMGGVDDRRVPPLPMPADGAAPAGPAPRLVLRGFVMMGGVVIKA